MKALISKAGIETGDMEMQVTVNRKSFGEIPNILVCRDKRVLVVVEVRRPYCWFCSALGHMAKECPGKSTQPLPRPSAAVVAVPAEGGSTTRTADVA